MPVPLKKISACGDSFWQVACKVGVKYLTASLIERRISPRNSVTVGRVARPRTWVGTNGPNRVSSLRLFFFFVDPLLFIQDRRSLPSVSPYRIPISSIITASRRPTAVALSGIEERVISARLLANGKPLTFRQTEGRLEIDIPQTAPDPNVNVIALKTY
jgi:hypothetical protein